MKKLMTIALMAVAALTANAQDIQLHYDFGRNIYPDEEDGRQKVTVTVEQFKADNWGSWYYFVDLDLSRKFFRSAYTEISREFKFKKTSPFAFHASSSSKRRLPSHCIWSTMVVWVATISAVSSMPPSSVVPTMATMPTSRRPGQYS